MKKSTKPIKIICVIKGGLPSFYLHEKDAAHLDVTVLDRDVLEMGELDPTDFAKIEARLAKMKEIRFSQPRFCYSD